MMLMLSDEAQGESCPKKKDGDAASDPDCFPERNPATLIRSSVHVKAAYCAKSTSPSCAINHLCLCPVVELCRKEEILSVAHFWKKALKHTFFWKSAPHDITKSLEVVSAPQDDWLKAAFRPCGRSDNAPVLA